MPLRSDIATALSATDLKVGAVCVYPALVTHAASALEGSDIPVASVAAGFPDGLTPLQTRIDEVRGAHEAGATEIDIVIRRGLALTEDWTRECLWRNPGVLIDQSHDKLRQYGRRYPLIDRQIAQHRGRLQSLMSQASK